MKKICQNSVVPLLAILLIACATTPEFDITGVDSSITPSRAVNELQTLQGKPVLWGGVIIAGTNLKEATQFEILAYPLDASNRPDTEQTPLGRFLAEQAGYVETTDFAQGRLLTVRGTLKDTRTGRIGETEYTYPLLAIDQLHLWPKQGDATEPRIQFGIGVMFHN
jgi:outer membrane lipoprotein